MTHKPPPEVFEGYTHFEWGVVCREVAKLKVHRRAAGEVLQLPIAQASGAEKARGFVTVPVTVPTQMPVAAMKAAWPSPDSNRDAGSTATDFESVSSTNFDRGPKPSALYTASDAAAHRRLLEARRSG